MRLAVALLLIALGVATSPVGSEARSRVAQVAPNAADRAIAAVERGQRERVQIAGERAALAAGYERQLAEVDRLKRQKASWRRDRQLRDAMSSSLETAKRLQAVTGRLRDADARLAQSRRALVATVDAELATVPAPARRSRLVSARGAARAALGERPHKIVLPDDELDPLADPEELEQQAAALRDSEVELAREVDSLGRQATHFRRMSDLRQQHDRASILALRDDEGPRRRQASGSEPVRAGGGGADSPTPPPTQSPPPNPPPSSPGEGGGGGDESDPSPPISDPPAGRDDVGFGSQTAVILSDVVDGATLDALRRAERSTDPAAKAAAAELARRRVSDRLRLLRERRAAIERRARELRTPR